jgi:uncharacterized surface protein with fasciclin (FAS1) repeats
MFLSMQATLFRSFLAIACLSLPLALSSQLVLPPSPQIQVPVTALLPQASNAQPATPDAPAEPPAEPAPEIQGGAPYPPLPPSPPATMKLVELVLNTPSLHTFLVVLKSANMGGLLQENGPYTVFAPNDAAFKRLPPGALQFLSGLSNRPRLTARIKYHIVPGTFLASNFVNGMELLTLEGKMVRISVKGTDIHVNNAKVVQTNLVGTNGVLHIIDRVLVP